jgi:DNA-binding GntR family transcriptional regulator
LSNAKTGEGLTSTTSAVERTVGAIVRAVWEGTLVPGQRLMEIDTSRRLGVSRATVREAFQRLEVDGLLSCKRHQGYQIRRLTRAETAEAFDVREALEGMAARLASKKGASLRKSLRLCLGELDYAARRKDLLAFSGHNRDFHARLVEAAENKYLARILEASARTVHQLQFRLLVDVKRVLATNEEHHAIAKAVLEGDAAKAERLARAHVRHTRTMLMALPDECFAVS